MDTTNQIKLLEKIHKSISTHSLEFMVEQPLYLLIRFVRKVCVFMNK